MNATYSDSTAPAMAPLRAEAGNGDRLDNFLYQAATVLAILLFLISF